MTPALVEEISAAVAALSPELDWEFGPGTSRRHALAVSAVGSAELRPLVERWRRAAPEDDLFEFHASRQPVPATGWSLEFAGTKVAYDDVLCSLSPDAQRERVDVALHHPAFARAPREALRMAFVILDNALGEDDVERWIGSIQANADAAEASVPLSTLRRRIDAFAAACTGQAWALLRGEREGMPVFAVANLALKRIDHVLHDLHVEVRFALARPRTDGLPEKVEADELDALEDRLVAELGDHAVHVGRETWKGTRTVYFHTMESGPASALFARFAAAAGRPVEIATELDPAWRILDRYG